MTRESGILKEITSDNYQDKNGNYAFTGKVDIKGQLITVSIFAKTPQYPKQIGTLIYFDIDWAAQKNNKYKGNYYRILKVRDKEGEDKNNNYQTNRSGGTSSSTQQNQNQHTGVQQAPPPPSINNMDKLKVCAITAAIKYAGKIQDNLPEGEVARNFIEKLAEFFMNSFLSPNKDVQLIFTTNALLQAIDLCDLNYNLAAPVTNKEIVVNVAYEYLKYYKPDLEIENGPQNIV